jgi:MtfA peptidase
LDRVLVAASAIIPIFGFSEWKYRNLTNVILYPDTFNGEFQYEGADRNILGMVGSGYMNGQMILSQSSLRKGFANPSDKHNTAIHEFVHLLDKSDGAVDGLPENLLQHSYSLPWLRMMQQEIRRIKEGKSDIDPYGATSETEFLAVVAEYFFEQPTLLATKHPELFDMLTRIFHQNTQERT